MYMYKHICNYLYETQILSIILFKEPKEFWKLRKLISPKKLISNGCVRV